MWTNIVNIGKTAAAFLQEGVVPPNTPPADAEEVAGINHLASKKFFLTLSAFLILGIFFAASVFVLFLMAAVPVLLGTYSVLFSKTIEVFAVIMSVYLGGQALVDLKYNSSSSANVNTSIAESDITNRAVTNTKEEDYTLETK